MRLWKFRMPTLSPWLLLFFVFSLSPSLLWGRSEKLPYNIYGTVKSEEKPLAGIIVSDGYELTKTNTQGQYYLSSAKRNGYVFVTTPGDYTYKVKDAIPQFWQNLTKDTNTAEQHDFQLIPCRQKNYTLIGLTDIHLANQYNDQQNLREKVMPVIQDVIYNIKKKHGKNQKIYTLNGGDSSYDTYWKVGNYTIRDFPNTLKDLHYPTPMFSIMGNHDNDPFVLFCDDVDFKAEQAYRDALGPTYYSFNIGQIHFVMLDNIIYKNHPGTRFKEVGLPGEKDYDTGITQNQLDWMKKDLKEVDASTPLIVCMHSPLFMRKGLNTKDSRNNFYTSKNLDDFLNLIKKYKEIHIIDGHTHHNYTYINDTLNLIDHNISSICGSWWRTSFKGYDTFTMGRTPQGEKVLHKGHDEFCPDGTPTGIEVFHIDGKKITWDFVSINDPANKQMRTFDMNEVKKYSLQDKNYAQFIKAYTKRCDYRKLPDNQVWLNIWAWDRSWKIKVLEDGKEIPAKPALLENPQYTFCYNYFMTVDNGRFDNPSYNKVGHANFFLIQCSKPNSTLEIEVTDHFGKIYKETMERPKAFFPDMK